MHGATIKVTNSTVQILILTVQKKTEYPLHHTAVNIIPGFFRMYEVTIKYAKPLTVKRKGKAVPVQTWKGPEGSRRLRLPDCRRICT
jgi:hypothetical protein